MPALWKDQPIFYSVTLCSCLRKPLDRSPRQPSPMTTHSVGSSTKPFTWCIVELDGVWLPLLLDTAASRSLLNVSTVRWLFSRQVIRADAEEKNGYRHANIGMVGTTIFSSSSKTHSAFLFQVSSQGGNLLEFDLFRALCFSITDCMAHPGSNAGCHFTLDWAALLLSTTNCSSNLRCPDSSNLYVGCPLHCVMS